VKVPEQFPKEMKLPDDASVTIQITDGEVTMTLQKAIEALCIDPIEYARRVLEGS
jgi:hypothetical protein